MDQFNQGKPENLSSLNFYNKTEKGEGEHLSLKALPPFLLLFWLIQESVGHKRI